jgi:tetratricopeptide (TPR) repeat protein
VAHELAAEGRFRDAQLYVDLKGTDPISGSAGLTPGIDPAAALQALLSALLGPDPQRPTDVDALSGLWRRAIHGKDAVLILDNTAGAGQVQPLLPGCPTCAVLVTSRRCFSLTGTSRLDLDPMDPAGACALLQHLTPGLDDEGASAIADLCGHLPLALRVAGNYLALNDDVSPGQYATRLADEADRLAHFRDPDDHDLAVETAIAVSVAQLDDVARRAWALLALFPAPFDLAAAAALWDQPDERAAFERLHALRNRSLVAYDAGTGRYEQHDLLRLAAARELADSAEGEIPAARERLARHYLAVAWQARDTQRYLDLDPDLPHFRAALEHAASLSNVDLLSDLAYALAPYLSARGLARDQIDWCQRAARACAAAGRRRDAGAHVGNLGLAYASLGELLPDGDRPGAIQHYEAALAIAREMGDRRNEGAWLGNLGTVYYRLGELLPDGDRPGAIQQYEAALAIAREIGDRGAEGALLGNLGLAYADLGKVLPDGDRPGAIQQYEQALAIAREIGDRRGEETRLGNLGAAYARLGETRKAIEQYEAALAIVRETGDRRGEGAHLGNLGLAYEDLGEPTRARECWTQALALFEATEDPNAETVRGWLTEMGLSRRPRAEGASPQMRTASRVLNALRELVPHRRDRRERVESRNGS